MECHQRQLLDHRQGGGVLSTLHSQRGVTLIELMIGLTIAAILLTIGAPSFSDWIQNMRIRNAAESIVNGLQLTRMEAVKRNTTVRFQLAGSGTDSSWSSCLAPDAVSACTTEIQSHSSNEGSTAGIEASTTNRTLFFNGLGRVPTLGAGTNAIINITNLEVDNCLSDPQPGTMRCLNIIVTPAGQIRMCNPALALASNPQGC